MVPTPSPNSKSRNPKRKSEESPSLPSYPPSGVIKSPLDPNSYKILTLPNGLKVILTSTLNPDIDLENQTSRSKLLAEIEEFNTKFIKLPKSRNFMQNNKPARENGCGDPPDCKKQKLDKQKQKSRRRKRSQSKSRNKYGSSRFHVALVIGVGSLSDPPDFQGLAHFCEHAITFGSKDFPEKKAIQALIKANCGTWKATTYPNRTVFAFDVESSERFERGIDILSDTMVHPLFPKEWIEKEVNAVDSEFHLRELSTSRRFRQILLSCAQEGHALHHFSTGNSSTLQSENLHATLCEWKSKYYRAGNITLAITAPKTIEELENLVTRYFTRISECNCGEISPTVQLLQNFSHNPFDTENFRKYYKIVPATDVQCLSLCWELPVEMWTNYDTKPMDFIAFLFRNGSPVSNVLKGNNWISDIDTSSHYSSIFSSVLQICVALTDSGLKNVDRVIETILSYLKTLEAMNPASALREFNKFRQIKANEFHFCHGLAELTDTAALAYKLQTIPNDKEILTSSAVVTNFDHALICGCLRLLIPSTANIAVFSKTFQNNCMGPYLIEPWYQTQYTAEPLTAAIIHKFNNVRKFKQIKFSKIGFLLFKLPENTTNSRIISLRSNRNLKILLKTQRAFVYYSKCRPKIDFVATRTSTGVFNIKISSYVVQMETPVASVLMSFWRNMLEQKICTILGAKSELFQCSLTITKEKKFHLLISGPTTGKLTRILENFIEEFDWFEEDLDESDFKDFREEQIRNLENASIDSSSFCWDCTNFLKLQNHLLFEQKRTIIENTSFKEFLEFVRNFKSKMFITVQLQGSVLRTHAKAVVRIIDDLTYDPQPFVARSGDRAMQIPLGEKCLRVKAMNSHETLSIVLNHYQFGNIYGDDKNRAKCLARVMRYPAFLQLRTDEQLSYIVNTNYSEYCNVCGISFGIYPNPSKHTTAYVDVRIDDFLEKFYNDHVISSAALSKLLEANHIESETKNLKEFKQMYANYLLPTGMYFRKISIQILGTPSEGKSIVEPPKDITAEKLNSKIHSKSSSSPSDTTTDGNSKLIKNIKYCIPECDDSENYFIKDIEAFKRNMYCYPE